MIYGLLENAYAQDEVDGETRTLLRFPACVAPIQVAIFPLMNRDGLDEIAKNITRSLHGRNIHAEYDDSGAIGRRYRRQDEIGTPYAITVDYESKEDGTVTIRDRDTTSQVRVSIEDVASIISELILGTKSFSEL
jgi:glycyl-tRNA synthetase